MIKKIIAAIFGLGINLAIYAVAAFLIIQAGAFVYDFSYAVFGEPVVDAEAEEEIIIEVQSGDGSQSIASKLKSEGAIENEMAFAIKARLSGSDLMPGTYVVKASMSADEMLEWMSDQSNSIVVQKTAEQLEAEAAETVEETVEETAETSEGEGGQ